MTNRMAANIATARRNSRPQPKPPAPPPATVPYTRQIARFNTLLLQGTWEDGTPLSPEARDNIEADRAECYRTIEALTDGRNSE